MQRIIGIIVGAIVTFLLLLLFDEGTRIVSDVNQGYTVAVILGAIATWAWPVVIGWWLVRRAKDRQQDKIEAEVQRQINEQNKSG